MGELQEQRTLLEEYIGRRDGQAIKYRDARMELDVTGNHLDYLNDAVYRLRQSIHQLEEEDAN